MKDVTIGLLIAALSFTSYRLAEVENQRYALVTGLCAFNPADPRSLDCLENVETRTSPLWNLYYGLFE